MPTIECLLIAYLLIVIAEEKAEEKVYIEVVRLDSAERVWVEADLDESIGEVKAKVAKKLGGIMKVEDMVMVFKKTKSAKKDKMEDSSGSKGYDLSNDILVREVRDDYWGKEDQSMRIQLKLDMIGGGNYI